MNQSTHDGAWIQAGRKNSAGRRGGWGTQAISTAPVFNAEGTRTATFTSIWRQEEPGVWRLLFDNGTKYCE